MEHDGVVLAVGGAAGVLAGVRGLGVLHQQVTDGVVARLGQHHHDAHLVVVYHLQGEEAGYL